MATEIERRYIKTNLRMQMTPDDKMPDKKKPMMQGHAALFNTLSEDLGGFREQIAPGAFTNALKDCDVRCLWNHDSNHVLGRSKSGTLRLMEDDQGLAMENDMPNTMCAQDLMESMSRGDVDQMSFGFRVLKDSWDQVGNGIIRTILEVSELFDVSPVTFPAYPDTSVAMRSLEEFKKSTAQQSVDNSTGDCMVNLKSIEEEDALYGLITE